MILSIDHLRYFYILDNNCIFANFKKTHMATLQKIRDKSWLLVTVIGVALLAFVFMDGASSLSGGGCNSTPVENVGAISGVDISIEDFENKN